MELPTLTAPHAGEPLTLYLSATDIAIWAVLLTDRKKVQTPIYYVSRTLTDPKTRYSMLEKLVMTLVYAAMRLCRYFQGHPINMLTWYKLKNVLSKPELSRRLEKWAIEFGEHAIEYKPRPSIKGQVLVDFVTEVPQHNEKECLIEQQPQVPPEQGQVWSLVTDGALSSEGSGAGLSLVNPKGQEFTYAIKLDFKSTNNEAEYEAFLAGLRIAKKLGVKHLEARVNSMLIAGQINGTYEAKNDVMASYVSQEKDLIIQFSSCKVVHIKRSEKKSADALSKLASTNFEHFAKDIFIEVLDRPSVPQNQVLVIQTGVESWMTPIMAYLSSEVLPAEKTTARKIKHKALNYQMNDGVLYQRSFLGPLLRCVDAEDTNYLIREVHEGICGLHAGPRMVVAKLMNVGYYWPGMHLDVVHEIKKCDSCQRHAPNTLRPKNELVPVTSAWPFQKWAIDILGPFPEASGQVKFLIVTIDYFTKWVEAKPVASITASSVKKFLWEFIICRFGLPLELVSDVVTQFADSGLQEWLKELHVTQIFTSVAHPQANGQVERTNRTIKEGIKVRLGTKRTGWVDELPHVLWAFRTHKFSSNSEMPFSLTYGTEAMIPAEIGVPSARL
ncbi:uncharacterized protein LOC143605174 [Bidens hawaiensis]|uniref:uncharacterized protein LOC143605174 n=1 Tax=Bidens hawaiensis TaxID=980011 RepID=UPI0040496BB6